MPTTSKPITFDHLKSRKKPVTRSVWIALDSGVAEHKEDLERQVKALRIRAKARPEDESLQSELAEEEAELQSAIKALRKDSVKFVFTSLGRRKYDELVTNHQATEEQQKKAKDEEGPEAVLEFNYETFPPALVAACIQEPSLTESEVHELFLSDEWNNNELMTLFNTALSACITRQQVNLGNG